jgi:hypothetical protein
MKRFWPFGHYRMDSKNTMLLTDMKPEKLEKRNSVPHATEPQERSEL